MAVTVVPRQRESISDVLSAASGLVSTLVSIRQMKEQIKLQQADEKRQAERDKHLNDATVAQIQNNQKMLELKESELASENAERMRQAKNDFFKLAGEQVQTQLNQKSDLSIFLQKRYELGISSLKSGETISEKILADGLSAQRLAMEAAQVPEEQILESLKMFPVYKKPEEEITKGQRFSIISQLGSPEAIKQLGVELGAELTPKVVGWDDPQLAMLGLVKDMTIQGRVPEGKGPELIKAIEEGRLAEVIQTEWLPKKATLTSGEFTELSRYYAQNPKAQSELVASKISETTNKNIQSVLDTGSGIGRIVPGGNYKELAYEEAKALYKDNRIRQSDIRKFFEYYTDDEFKDERASSDSSVSPKTSGGHPITPPKPK